LTGVMHSSPFPGSLRTDAALCCEIKKLDMDEDGMTMVFDVQDTTMLKQVKVGDKVLFDADQAAAGLTITKLQKSK
jgi:Cu/Ag efflux protein CusF